MTTENKATPITALDNYRILGRTGLRVSPLCLGAMTFGQEWGFGNSAEESKKVFDAYASKGGNFIDTANVYTNGTSEKFVGEYISQYRSNFVVATKFTFSTELTQHKAGVLGRMPNPNSAGGSRKSLVENLDASLKRMGTGYVDLLYLHHWDYNTPAVEVMRSFDDVIRSGKALYVGVSDSPAWLISQANTIAELRGWSQFAALQTRWNLLDRSFEYDLGDMAAHYGMSTIPWGILAEGFLTGKHKRDQLDPKSGRGESLNRRGLLSVDKNWEILKVVEEVAAEINRTPGQVAINWIIRMGASSPLLGARDVAQLEQNLGALEFTLTDAQLKRLNDVSKPASVPFPHSILRNQVFAQFKMSDDPYANLFARKL